MSSVGTTRKVSGTNVIMNSHLCVRFFYSVLLVFVHACWGVVVANLDRYPFWQAAYSLNPFANIVSRQNSTRFSFVILFGIYGFLFISFRFISFRFWNSTHDNTHIVMDFNQYHSTFFIIMHCIMRAIHSDGQNTFRIDIWLIIFHKNLNSSSKWWLFLQSHSISNNFKIKMNDVALTALHAHTHTQ